MYTTYFKYISIVLGLIFAIIICEVIAQVYLSVHEKYSNNETLNLSGNVLSTQSGKNNLPVVHPFWGKSLAPRTVKFTPQRETELKQMVVEGEYPPEWIKRLTNNHGFISEFDYPRLRQSNNEYFIAILGGSVAERFSYLGEKAFISALKKNPFFKEKEIIILNFGNGGFKQPQQLMILNYFLFIGQEIDLVLNIDGFNEAALSWSNNVPLNVDISLPRRYPGPLKTLLKSATIESVLWQADKIRLEEKINKLKTRNDQIRSALLILLKRGLSLNYERQLYDHMANVPQYDENRDSGFFRLPLDKRFKKNQIQHNIIEQWVKASTLIHAISKDNKSHYFHLLQPNQYYSNRQFNNEEKEIAFNMSDKVLIINENGKAIAEMYPLMETRLEQEKLKGLPIYNGLNIFDTEPRRVYTDSCCHYTDIGNRLMAEFIAKQINHEFKHASIKIDKPEFKNNLSRARSFD